MIYRVIYFLLVLFLVINFIILAIGNITGINIYQKYNKNLKIIFWSFIIFLLIFFIACGITGLIQQ